MKDALVAVSPDNKLGTRAIPVRSHQVAPGFDLFVVDVPAFPIPEGLRNRLSSALWRFIEPGAKSTVGDLTLWLLGDTLYRNHQARHVSQNSVTWRPLSGLGRRPDQEPPRMSRGSDFLDIAWGEQPRVPYHRVLRLGAESDALKSAWELMFGKGNTMLTLGAGGSEAFLEAVREPLKRDITDDSFQDFSFYFPILSVEAIFRATEDKIKDWMGTLNTYIRESEEDGAVIILTRKTHTSSRAVLEESGFSVPVELP